MTLFDKKFASGFIAGIVALFSIMSVFLMNPEQMWRWLLHNNSVDEKVERALSKPSEQMLSLERKVSSLHDQLVQANRNIQEKESILE
ncbi:MAG: hypothetical protein ACUZ8O_13205, partial [Candidatus Anammoxibacter sp.]